MNDLYSLNNAKICCLVLWIRWVAYQFSWTNSIWSMAHEIWLNKQSNLTFLIFAVSQTKELAQKTSYRLNTAQGSYIYCIFQSQRESFDEVHGILTEIVQLNKLCK